MRTIPQVFNFRGSDIREVTDEYGEPWFVAKDVTDILEMSNGREAVRQLDIDEKRTVRITDGGPERAIINESGLYSLILRSRKPEAKAFKKWITSEVLPSIRKTGKYSTNIQPVGSEIEMERQTLEVIAWHRQKMGLLEAENASLRIRANVADTIAGSKGLILLSDAGKQICGHPIKFIQWAEESGILFRRKGGDPLLPKAEYDKKYFQVNSKSVDGYLREQVYLTPLGLTWITARYNRDHSLLSLDYTGGDAA